MRTATVAPCLAVASTLAGCGGATASLATDNAGAAHGGAPTLRPEPGVVYELERMVLRTRRGERNVSGFAGELRAVAPGVHRVSIVRARQAQGDRVIREIDPARGDARLELEQRIGLRGAGAQPLTAEARFALGEELAQGLTLVPVGGSGLVWPLPSDGHATLVLGWPAESGLPPEIRVRCAEEPGADATTTHVRCEGPLDRDLEVSEAARADGISAALRGTVSVEATIERASGLALELELELRMDVVQRMGPYEEHDAAEVTLRSELSPP